MALPMLVNGADCGPVNPLQGLTKRFDQDRGIQQDQFGTNRAGPSRQTFRTAPLANPALEQEAARFFARDGPQTSSSPIGTSQSAFDLSALRRAVPNVNAQMRQSPSSTVQMSNAQSTQALASSSWASDFLAQSSSPVVQADSRTMQSNSPSPMQQSPAPTRGLQSMSPMPLMTGSRLGVNSMLLPSMQHQPQDPVLSPASWEKEFLAHDTMQSQRLSAPNQEVQERPQTRVDADELAKTAALLVETVKAEQNPKFKNSEFMKLMMGLRDGDIVVDGEDLVQRSEARSTEKVDVKGKGKAAPSDFRPVMNQMNSIQPSTTFMQQSLGGQAFDVAAEKHETPRTNEVDENLAYFQKENEDYMEYWSERAGEPQLQDRIGTPGWRQEAEWGDMQRSWDAYEATTWGVRPVPQYQFQPHNPYLRGDSSQKTRHHGLHAGQALHESVLELEADVQRDPTNASAWFNLGVKQQENERESKAVLALGQAIALDPTHLPAWLALAISHTNESERDLAEDAVNQWIRNNPRYEGIVKEHIARYEALNGVDADSVTKQMRRDGMIQCLMTIAQAVNQAGDIDADIQIALAVLLNTGGDYTKAQDCFEAALSARPDDWQLYNRVGATLANGGASEQALQYYYRALELNPTYIRARFNIGIACLNMKRYDEAAQYILDALLMQDSDGSVHSGGDKRGITSSTLWDSLRTASLHLQRSDLASLCDKKDLDGFRREFHG